MYWFLQPYLSWMASWLICLQKLCLQIKFIIEVWQFVFFCVIWGFLMDYAIYDKNVSFFQQKLPFIYASCKWKSMSNKWGTVMLTSEIGGN